MSRKFLQLMVHHTVTASNLTVDDIRKLHLARGFTDIGYHYLIQRDSTGRGHLKVGRPDTQPGAHCPAGGYNKTAIGMSVIGCFHPGYPFSERLVPDTPLYNDIVGAAAHLCEKYHIPADSEHILYHRDAKPTACPGAWFADKARFISDVKKCMAR